MENKNSIGLRAVFMGTSSFAATILKSLIKKKYNIVAVYTQPDKKVGRKQETQKSAVKILAEEHNLPIFEPTKFQEAEINELKEQKPDLIIVIAYGKILPAVVLGLPGFGAINVHASLLPDYRGPSPIQNAILNGKKKTGTTIMLMDKGIDTGPILSQEEVVIGSDETTAELSERLAVVSAKLLLNTIPRWIERKIESKPQNDSVATLCQLIERSDGKIIWANDAEEIYNQYRAFIPWPGTFTFWEREEHNFRIKLNRILLVKKNIQAEYRIGEVFKFDDSIGVQTNSGIIVLEEVQMEGKDNMSIRDFINGNPTFIGSVLK